MYLLFQFLLSCLIVLLKVSLLLSVIILFLIILLFAASVRIRRVQPSEKSLTFVHPNCADCGGGEKVLWEILKALLENEGSNPLNQIKKIYIIAAPGKDVSSILKLVRNRFNLTLSNFKYIKSIQIVRINAAEYLLPQPRFTMLLQIIGQIVFAMESGLRIPNNSHLIDTTGLPFTYIVYKILGFKISAYTHYPFISKDMIKQVTQGSTGYVHSRGLFSLPLLKNIKVLYYKLILLVYELNGNAIEFTFTNSTWTNNHVSGIWSSIPCVILYPPCGVEDYLNREQSNKRENIIVSLGQFRPEKDHLMQVEIMNQLILKGIDYKLYMIGGVRTVEDQGLVKRVEAKIKEYKLETKVQCMVNADYKELQKMFTRAKIGLHTMKDEHFGISVIELMASGLITVAHNSAGPRYDIIGNTQKMVGFLSSDVESFVNNIVNIDKQYHTLHQQINENASLKVMSFSCSAFRKKFIDIFSQHY